MTGRHDEASQALLVQAVSDLHAKPVHLSALSEQP